MPEKARISDLPAILNLFEQCRRKLLAEQIEQWDDEYPGRYPQKDIEAGTMYKWLQDGKIIAAVTVEQSWK